MDHLLARIETLEQHVQALTQQTTSVARRLRWWRRLAFVLMVLSLFSLPRSLGEAQNAPPGPADRGLAQRVRALEQKLQHVTSEIGPEGFPELVITGANLRIVNGLGFTETTNGTGNLIVGYNEPRDIFQPDVRTGSHNVVVGQRNNFSRFGGLVVGDLNEIGGDFATVSGGFLNAARGDSSSISGGFSNAADGTFSSVSGGRLNLTSGEFGSSVSGGWLNTASGVGSSVSGGLQNIASGDFATVSGGVVNTASGAWSSVSGGSINTASGFSSSVSGGGFDLLNGVGAGNIAAGISSSVSGGTNRTAQGNFGWVAGGLFQDQ